MTTYRSRHTFGTRVWLKVRDADAPGLVVAVTFRPEGHYYAVVWDDASESCHYEFELVTEFSPFGMGDDP